MTTEFEDPRLAQIRVELGKTEAELYEELACTLSKDALPNELWRRGQEIFLNIVDEAAPIYARMTTSKPLWPGTMKS
jgi:hypothetical protein